MKNLTIKQQNLIEIFKLWNSRGEGGYVETGPKGIKGYQNVTIYALLRRGLITAKRGGYSHWTAAPTYWSDIWVTEAGKNSTSN